jgi:hypothetical protein
MRFGELYAHIGIRWAASERALASAAIRPEYVGCTPNGTATALMLEKAPRVVQDRACAFAGEGSLFEFE